MRLHQVTSRLFTGPKMSHDDALWAVEIGITHHITVAKEVRTDPDPLLPDLTNIENLAYDLEKDITDDWIRWNILDGLEILSDPQNKLLITCLAGKNRAPSAAYAILRAFGLDQMTAKSLSKGHIAPKYAHIVDRYVDRTLNLP